MPRVIGIDPGTVSIDLCGLEDGRLFLDRSIPTSDALADPARFVRLLEDAGPLDLVAGPSGYGLPLTRARDATGGDRRHRRTRGAAAGAGALPAAGRAHAWRAPSPHRARAPEGESGRHGHGRQGVRRGARRGRPGAALGMPALGHVLRPARARGRLHGGRRRGGRPDRGRRGGLRRRPGAPRAGGAGRRGGLSRGQRVEGHAVSRRRGDRRGLGGGDRPGRAAGASRHGAGTRRVRGVDREHGEDGGGAGPIGAGAGRVRVVGAARPGRGRERGDPPAARAVRSHARARGIRRGGEAGSTGRGARRRRARGRYPARARRAPGHPRGPWQRARSSVRGAPRAGITPPGRWRRMTRVLIAGVSSRGFAESAARAGYDVRAVDGFGDLDLRARAHVVRVARSGGRFSSRAAVAAARGLEADVVCYVGSLENHPRAVGALSAGRTLWGNRPAVLAAVRDPVRLARALRAEGLPTPAVRVTAPRVRTATRGRWLVKPRASGGGSGVTPWRGGPLPRGSYLQQRVTGIAGSIVFAADGY